MAHTVLYYMHHVMQASMPLPDSQTTAHAVATLANFSRDGIGYENGDKNFFLAVGLHKP